MNRQFKKLALYTALDTKRRSRGMSWQRVAREIGVASSTISRAQHDGPMETDGMLAMVRWLGCAPEEFMADGGRLRKGQPPAGRFNVKSLYRALDERRRANQMTWKDVCRELDINASPAMLTRLSKGGRIDVHFMVACVHWLSLPVATFTGNTALESVDPN